MNQPINMLEMLQYATKNVAEFNSVYIQIGYLDQDNGDQLTEDEVGDLLSDRLMFLCEDSPVPAEIRKAALEYQSAMLVAALTRLHQNEVVITKSSPLLAILEEASGEVFVDNCRRRAQVLHALYNKAQTAVFKQSDQQPTDTALIQKVKP